MKVNELINELQKMPQEAQVAIYSEIAEDSDIPNAVELHSADEENTPYNKGDDVWSIYGINRSEKLVFISANYYPIHA